MTSQPKDNPLTAARRRDVQNRRIRVRKTLVDMQSDGSEITLSAVAARAKVHRSFLHRHTDLHAEILHAAEQSAPTHQAGTVTRRTIDADYQNLRETVRRQSQHIAPAPMAPPGLEQSRRNAQQPCSFLLRQPAPNSIGFARS
jgi:hypothetical protein